MYVDYIKKRIFDKIWQNILKLIECLHGAIRDSDVNYLIFTVSLVVIWI